MILGIWTNDLDIKNTKKLADKGFNGIFMLCGYYWEQCFSEQYTEAQVQDRTVNLMKQYYLNYKEQGYEYFLIDGGWGLGNYNDGNNYFFKKIIDAFKNCNDVEFYLGEPLVEWMEKSKIPFDDVLELIKERKSIDKRWIIDAPARQQDLYKFDALSSYMNQGKHWRGYHTFAWIYGSLTYTVLFGSLCYESKKKQLDKLGISKIFLYQGDKDWMTIKWFDGYLQDKFIKIFGGTK